MKNNIPIRNVNAVHSRVGRKCESEQSVGGRERKLFVHDPPATHDPANGVGSGTSNDGDRAVLSRSETAFWRSQLSSPFSEMAGISSTLAFGFASKLVLLRRQVAAVCLISHSNDCRN